MDKSLHAVAISRRNVLKLGVAASVAPGIALAQGGFGSKPIRLMTGFPGGTIDVSARLLAPGLGEALGATVIVESKPGASGVLASDFVAKAPGDGYTLLVATPSPVIVATQTMAKQTFNPLSDLKGINMVSRTPLTVAVHPGLHVHTMKELVALAQKRRVTLGTNGLGTSLHILVEILNQAYKADLQVIPYKSSSSSAIDAIAGHIDGCVSDLGAFLPFHQDGKLVLVAVTSAKRVEQLSDVPAISEDIPGFTMENWLGVFAPGSTPAPLVETINAALHKTLASEQVRTQIRKMSAVPAEMATPLEFQKFVAAEYQRFGKVIKDKSIVFKE
jgi:tripartite-type tricarboxylate transporter receptor subunit TctC